jgi:hypothetical protein
MKQLIAIGLGLLFGASAAFAADATTDAAQPAAAPAKTTTKKTMRTGRRIHHPATLESKAAKRSAKALDSTGKDMEKALK